MRRLRRALALASALAFGGFGAERAGAQQAATVDLVGVTTATFEWAPATGSVAAYLVYVARDGVGFPSVPEGFASASDRRVTVQGQFGQSLRVRVAAMGSNLAVGPMSAASDEVRFLARPPLAPPYDFQARGASDLLLRNTATGLLTAWNVFPTATVRTFTSGGRTTGVWDVLDSGDYDGDGRSDLLWHDAVSGRVQLCRSDGASAGLCADFMFLPTGWSLIGLGDTDGDGRRDVLLRTEQGAAQFVCLGTGSSLSICGASFGSFPDSSWRLLAPGDVDGDQRADLVFHEVGTGLVLACGVRRTSVGACNTLLSLGAGMVVTPIGDATGDGLGELVVRDAAGAVTIVCSLAGGRLRGCAALAGIEPRWTLVGAGDYDGDGRADLVLRDAAAGLVRIDRLFGLAAKGPSVYLPANASYRVLAQH
jgi:hypothetical protein